MQKKMQGKKAGIIFPNIIFILLNLMFIALLIFFAARASSGALVYEQAHAKQIALILDQAKPNTFMSIDFQEAIDTAKKNSKTKNLVVLDKEKNKVTVSLSKNGGYSFKYFSDYNINTEVKGGLLVINVTDK